MGLWESVQDLDWVCFDVTVLTSLDNLVFGRMLLFVQPKACCADVRILQSD